MRALEFIIEEIKIDHKAQANAWIEKVYAKYPATWQNNHVMMWGEGDDQQLAFFELIPSMSKKDAVEVKWFQAYPLRQGVGSRAMRELQALAQEDNIALTLYPWDKGQVSQAKLMKFYKGQGFQPTVKGAKNLSWSPEGVAEGLEVDVPNEDWLQDKIDYAKSKGRNSFGVPYMGSTTASVRGTPPRVRVMRLASLPGMRNEQINVRKDDLKWLMDYMERTGKLPPKSSDPNDEYLPFIMVAYNGEAWVNEGNHRIMAAYRLNWPDMPVEIRYFDGGERVASGPMAPGKIGLGPVKEEQGMAEGKINPAGLNHTQQIGDYVYRAKALTGSDEGEIEMTAYDGKKSIADTVFMPYGSGGRMISGQTYVHPAYRGKGVAAGMYAYLRMLGFKIEPSAIRTGAGKAMWDKWEEAGDAKHLSKGVAESKINLDSSKYKNKAKTK